MQRNNNLFLVFFFVISKAVNKKGVKVLTLKMGGHNLSDLYYYSQIINMNLFLFHLRYAVLH